MHSFYFASYQVKKLSKLQMPNTQNTR